MLHNYACCINPHRMKISSQLTRLLSSGISGNQARLVEILGQQGVQTTQSSISRALKKINAIKGVDENGQTIYSLPQQGTGKRVEVMESGLFGSLVYEVLDNGHMIVIHTRPGTAPAVAKVIDDHGFEQTIGSVAGDDTILIIPSDVKKTGQVASRIISYLTGIGLY